MNRFVIVDGLPYLYADDGKTYTVRWDEKGFTVGAEVQLSVPSPFFTFSELSVKAKCAGRLDSITAVQDEQRDEQQAHETKLEELTVAELREFAEQRGIDLGEAKKKAEILEAIKGVME